jgi:hypothetical protein
MMDRTTNLPRNWRYTWEASLCMRLLRSNPYALPSPSTAVYRLDVETHLGLTTVEVMHDQAREGRRVLASPAERLSAYHDTDR